MKTKLLMPEEIDQAIAILRDGGILGVPSETVYGLAGDATKANALTKIFDAKDRPAANPLIVHVASIDQIQLYADIHFDWVFKCLELFSPGPLSIVLPYKQGLAAAVRGGLPTVAFRIPAHATFLNLLQQSQLPLAAPSANRSGRPSGTTWQAVLQDLDGRIDGIVCDTPSQWGLESTVVDATTQIPIILRHGAVTLEQLQSVAPKSRLSQPDDGKSDRSPGTRFRHYQPRAKVVVTEDFARLTLPIENAKKIAAIGFESQLDCRDSRFELVKVCSDVELYAQSLFEFFRRCDDNQIDTIYCQAVECTGLGRALADRLKRASS